MGFLMRYELSWGANKCCKPKDAIKLSEFDLEANNNSFGYCQEFLNINSFVVYFPVDQRHEEHFLVVKGGPPFCFWFGLSP